MHSARWRKDFDATGKNIVVIGSAASAVQLVPCLAEKAKRVTVFQRTANYVFPRNNRNYSAVTQSIFRYVPGAMLWYRLYLYWRNETLWVLAFRSTDSLYSKLGHYGTSFVLRKLFGEEKGKALTPNYKMGCKRVLVHDEWIPALLRPNVDILFSGIKRIEADGVVASSDGRKHPADVIIYATGFNPFSLWDLQIKGTEKQAEVLNGDTISSLYGTALPHRPNFFVMLGPNT